MTGIILFCVLELIGVTGDQLRARSFFDANNVKVGDPMVLTIDFIGSADFAELHPPRLSGEVSRADWKVDEASAKTDTFKVQIPGGFFSASREQAVGRRFTYRVRPIRAGVLTWPAIDFSYRDRAGGTAVVRANAIPVHAIPGEKVDIKLDATEEGTYPAFELDARKLGIGDDEAYALRRAYAKGDYRAVYDSLAALAWRRGQSPALEAALLAARARLYANPYIELPVWRVAGRPLLRYPLTMQILLVLGGVLALALVLAALGWTIRRLAAVALALLLVLPAAAASRQANDPFAEMEEMMRQQREQMKKMMSSGGGFSFSFGGPQQKPPEVKAAVVVSKPALQVGENFELVFSATAGTNAQVQIQNLQPRASIPGFTQAGKARRLADGRLALPVRVDAPFRGKVSFQVSGMVSMSSRTGGSSFSFSNSFAADTPSVSLVVAPLDPKSQPADFSGIVSEQVTFAQTADLGSVATNDVVTLTFRLETAENSYVPELWQPDGASYWYDENVWKGYFVADGAAKTPDRTISYYNPKKRTYEHATAKGRALTYHE